MKTFTSLKQATVLLALIFLSLMMSIQQAHALTSMQLTDGTTTIIIEDGSPDDIFPDVVGAVGYIGSIGVFNISVTTGMSTELLGTPGAPSLNLSSVGVSSSGSSGTLTIMLTETYLGPVDASLFETQAGGTSRGSVSFNSYIDTSNKAFGTGTLIGSLGPYGSGAFSGSTSTTYTTSDPFSMTAVAIINHDMGKKASSFSLNVVNVAPEPISYILFAIGSVILGGKLYLKRSSKKL